MKEELVSIITPCYNGEKYLDRYFESILSQTYDNIELIFINDGSTDRTEEIAKKYEEKLKERGYKYIYIYQDNAGQAEAINKGLKIFEGEFLTWPDSDDILERDSIEKRVKFLKNNPQYGLVRNSVINIDFDTNQIDGEFIIDKGANENIFEDLIWGYNVCYAPISYMLRTKNFLQVNPNRVIYNTRAGQNWQMLLPITHKYKCGIIREVLCKYYVRKDSHSRTKLETFNKEIEKIDSHIDILYNVLTEMGIYNKYEEDINLLYDKKKIKVALKYNKYDYIKSLLDEEKRKYKSYRKNYKYWVLKNKLLYKIYRKVK